MIPREWKPEEFKDMPEGNYVVWKVGMLSGTDLLLWTNGLINAFVNNYPEPEMTKAFGPFHK
jgi:hypothetical protein